MTIHQTRAISLGILEDDGSDWVGCYVGRVFFNAPDYFKTWMLYILGSYERILQLEGI